MRVTPVVLRYATFSRRTVFEPFMRIYQPNQDLLLPWNMTLIDGGLK